MADLTDYEINRRCAEIMGYDVIEQMDFGSWAVRYHKLSSNVFRYWPLDDDAQCMALVWKLNVTVVAMDATPFEAKPYTLAICQKKTRKHHEGRRAVCLAVIAAHEESPERPDHEAEQEGEKP